MTYIKTYFCFSFKNNSTPVEYIHFNILKNVSQPQMSFMTNILDRQLMMLVHSGRDM